MDVRFGPSLAELRPIKAIQFGILGPDEIRRMSVAEITSSETFDYNTKKPVANGLSDSRLGVADKLLECSTCGEGHRECPGHFGHIEFAKPIFHPGFLRTVINVLQCVCINCSRILADEERCVYSK